MRQNTNDILARIARERRAELQGTEGQPSKKELKAKVAHLSWFCMHDKNNNLIKPLTAEPGREDMWREICDAIDSGEVGLPEIMGAHAAQEHERLRWQRMGGIHQGEFNGHLIFFRYLFADQQAQLELLPETNIRPISNHTEFQGGN